MTARRLVATILVVTLLAVTAGVCLLPRYTYACGPAEDCKKVIPCQVWDNCSLWGSQCHLSYTYQLTSEPGDYSNLTQNPCAWIGVGVLWEVCIFPTGQSCGGPRGMFDPFC